MTNTSRLPRIASEAEKYAAFYHGYLIDDQSLAPLTVALATIVALWSLVYLVGCLAPLPNQPAAVVATQWSSLADRPASP
jgi:hypothetical protein